jgi:hypothetical protein
MPWILLQKSHLLEERIAHGWRKAFESLVDTFGVVGLIESV